MYTVNPARPEIRMSVVRTFRYEAEDRNDPRDNTPCVELKSDDGRYGLTITAEEFSGLPLAE